MNNIEYNYINFNCTCGYMIQTNKEQVKCLTCGALISISIGFSVREKRQCLKCSTEDEGCINLWDDIYTNFNGQKPSEKDLIEYLKQKEIEVTCEEDRDYIDLILNQFDMEVL